MESVHQPDLPIGRPDLYPVVAKSTILAVIADVAHDVGLSDHYDRLVRQCGAESSFWVAAHNVGSDCYGLFQLSGPTAKELGVNRYDWRDNIVGGVHYMARLLNYYNGDYAKALAGFNWGMGNVNRAVKANGAAWRDHLPKETADYLLKIL